MMDVEWTNDFTFKFTVTASSQDEVNDKVVTAAETIWSTVGSCRFQIIQDFITTGIETGKVWGLTVNKSIQCPVLFCVTVTFITNYQTIEQFQKNYHDLI